jgi:hypothetical protein
MTRNIPPHDFFPGNVFFENDVEDIDFKTFGVLNIEL